MGSGVVRGVLCCAVFVRRFYRVFRYLVGCWELSWVRWVVGNDDLENKLKRPEDIHIILTLFIDPLFFAFDVTDLI